MSYGSPPPPSDDRPDPTSTPDERPSEGYGSPPPPPPPSSPGYQEPPSSTGYQEPPSSTGYQEPPSSTGYQEPPSSTGYQQPAPSDAGSYPPPPPPAYGQQGQPAPQGQQGYGAAPSYTGPYEQQNQVGTLAQWPQRALGGLIDFIVLNIPTWILYAIGGPKVDATTGVATGPNLFYYLGVLYSLGFVYIYNRWYRGGTTGQTIGRGVAGVKVVKEADGQVLGMGMAFVRDLAHIVDSIICYVGWLFPLWDAKRQTLADKILSTVSVTVPKN